MKKGVIIGIAVSVAASLPFYGYMWNLMMHILGAILFMGNIFVSAVWFSLARRSRVPEAVAFAARGVVVTDVFFTTPGAVLLLINGGIIGTRWFKAGDVWLMISATLFIVAGIMWLAVLVPAQNRMLAISQSDPLSDEMSAVMARWFRVGGIASFIILIILVLMVWKPHF